MVLKKKISTSSAIVDAKVYYKNISRLIPGKAPEADNFVTLLREVTDDLTILVAGWLFYLHLIPEFNPSKILMHFGEDVHKLLQECWYGANISNRSEEAKTILLAHKYLLIKERRLWMNDKMFNQYEGANKNLFEQTTKLRDEIKKERRRPVRV